MLLRLLAAFVLIPLIELILLLRLAEATSWLTTLWVVLLTGIIGSVLARREGIAAWFRFQTAMQNGRMPRGEIRDGLMIAFAAALLLTPGLLTDALGFTLLTPVGRRVISGWFARHFQGRFEVVGQTRAGHAASARPSSEANPSRTNSGWTIDSPSFKPTSKSKNVSGSGHP